MNVLLKTPLPMCLVLGEELMAIYNDEFGKLWGSQSDAAAPLPEIWGEDWPVLQPFVERAREGRACRADDVRMAVARNGGARRISLSFAFTPVADEAVGMHPVLVVAQEGREGRRVHRRLTSELQLLTQLLDQAPGSISFLSGPNHVYQLRNQVHRRLIGVGRDIIGHSIREVAPELEAQGFISELDEVYASGVASKVYGRRVVLADATGALRTRYFDYVLQPVKRDDGSVLGILIEGNEVTDLAVAHAALRERDERLRLALEAGRMATWEVDVNKGEAVTSSPEEMRTLSVPPSAGDSPNRVNSEHFTASLDSLVAAVRDARQRGEPYFSTEYRHIAGDRAPRWLLARGATGLQDDVAPGRAFGVLMDITERKEAEQSLRTLALEIDHRANNILATAQSVVTLTRAENIDKFKERVLGRISALAHAHKLLAESRWKGASLLRIVGEELKPFMGEPNVKATGPDANLAPGVAQELAMALHELISNAVKHGALSNGTGLVILTWEPPDQCGLIHMTWSEHGGPAVREPGRRGFGMSLLRRTLSGSRGGGIELNWRPEGLHATLRFPVT